MEESNHIKEDEFPQEPSKPLDSECCGTGCTPCVFDIYDKQMAKWKLECDAIRRGQPIPHSPHSINPFLSPEKYQMVEIIDIIKETETIKIFRLLWPQVGGGVSFPVEVGQHVLIRCDSIARQYTILRVDEEQRVFDILIKIYKYEEVESTSDNFNPRKMLTPLLDKLRPTDQIEMRGPFGTIFDPDSISCSHLFLIAAGSGIAPMYRIIQNILQNEKNETKIKALFASSSLKEVPLIKDFKEWSSFWNFDILYFLPNHQDDKAQEQLAYYGMKIKEHKLDSEMLQEQVKLCRGNIHTFSFIICGTKSFEKDVINWLLKMGIDSNKMKLF